MTAYAYAQAARLPGLRALEVSVCRTADGVLVCSHDPTTTRTTGTEYTIAEQRWADLAALRVTAAATTDPAQPAQPLARFDEVAETYLDRFVLFVEAKVGAAVAPLLQTLASAGQPQRVVWKAPVNSRTFAAAKDLGFTTWGYVMEEPAHLGPLRRFAAAPEIDLLGAPRAAPDGVVSTISRAAQDNGKVTISWTIRSRADEQRVTRLGCRGLMTSHPREVVRAER